MREDGFALLAVLWMLALLAGAVALGSAATRTGQMTTANRIALARARWAAEACLAIVEARTSTQDTVADTTTVDLGRGTTCAWTVEYPDAGLDANTAPRSALVRLGILLGLPPDSATRFGGAVLEARATANFTDVNPLAALPGFTAALLPFLTVDGSGRVDALTAAPPVLATLPGLSPEAVDAIVRRRAFGKPLRNLDELSGALSPAGRAALRSGYGQLAPLLAFGSARVVVVARGWVASRGRYPEAAIRIVGVRLEDRLAVLRRRMF